MDRRGILKSSAAVLRGTFLFPESAEATLQNVDTHSGPSELRITDLRIAQVTRAPMECPIVRLDANQRIYGLGEVRDAGIRPTPLS